MDKSQTIRNWYDRVWEQQDFAAIDEIMVSDTQASGLGELPRVGPVEFRAFAEALLVHISNLKITIESEMEKGDWLHQLIRVNAKNCKTDADIEFVVHVLVKVVDGRILEAHNMIDSISLFEQLGFLPGHTMGTCLSGQVVA